MSRNIPGQVGQALEGVGRHNTHMHHWCSWCSPFLGAEGSEPAAASLPPLSCESIPGPAGRVLEGAGRHRAGAAHAGGPASP